MQGLEKDQLYLYQAYDVQGFYPRKLCTDTFGKQVRSTLYEALKQHNRLPAVLLIVTGNDKIDRMVSTPYHTKRIWSTLFTEIDRTLKARKNDLPQKAFLNEEPRVFITNVFPRYKEHCERLDQGFDTFRTKRRRLNNLLPQLGQKFDFEIISVNGIILDNPEFFEMSTAKLSGKGMREFWISVSRELKLADECLKDRICNQIIKSYLDDKKQEERLQIEKRNYHNEREGFGKQDNARPKPRYFDRGDFNLNRPN